MGERPLDFMTIHTTVWCRRVSSMIEQEIGPLFSIVGIGMALNAVNLIIKRSWMCFGRSRSVVFACSAMAFHAADEWFDMIKLRR